jgi:carbonic anhydrase
MSDRRSNLVPAVIIAAAAVIGGKLAASSNSATPAAAAGSQSVESPSVTVDTAPNPNASDVTVSTDVTTTSEFLGPTPTEVPRPLWGYGPDDGPATWGTIAADCDAGSGQSPIRVDMATASTNDATIPSFGWALSDTAGRLVNDGVLLTMVPEPGSGVRVDGTRFDLVQLDIHTPAEHVLDDEGYDAELVARFANAEGVQLHVSTLITAGSHNDLLDPIVDGIGTEPGFTHPTQGPVEFGDLMPVRGGGIFYVGSSTTPPCEPNVGRLVLGTAIEASVTQLQRLTEVLDSTNRPLQPQADAITVVIPPA